MSNFCSLSNLSIGYSASNTVISDINLSVSKGCLISLIGPNGIGKSTLIKSLCGLQPTLKGEILINGKSLQKYTPKELSYQLSFVLSEKIDSGKLRVIDIIAIGQHNHSNWWGKVDNKNKKEIDDILKIMKLDTLSDRFFFELSDGERQRVLIAKSLAQNTPLMILDEPTSYLDLPNRIEVFKLLKEIVLRKNKSVILSTHELDLALNYSDTLWIINENSSIKEYLPNDPNLESILQKSFGMKNFQLVNGRIIIN